MRYLKVLLIAAVALSSLQSQAVVVRHFSSDFNDYNFNISTNYDRAVFARADGDFANAKVWQALKNEDNEFLPPKMIELGPGQHKYSDPMLGHDGKTLIFISDRPLDKNDKSNDYNVWQASLIDGVWQDVKPLPQSVNSDADELGPEIHNGILYFTSGKKGYLSLFKGKKIGTDYAVSEYLPLSDSPVSRSDITFSPDGNITLFWQHTEDKKDTKLMMQRKHQGRWQTPVDAPPIIQSSHYEFTPQFSPDGQWVYFSSEKPNKAFKGLTIHKVASSEIFPTDWYEEHLGEQRVDVLGTQEQLDKITSFQYTLSLQTGDKQTEERIAINFSPFEVCTTQDDKSLWTNGTTGKEMSGTTSRALRAAEMVALVRTAQYNFVHMFKQQSTKLFRQYAAKQEQGRVFRVNVAGLEDFSVLLDAQHLRIEQLRYDDQAVGLEYDYQRHQNILWPMKFDFLKNNRTVAAGQFSDLKFNVDNPCQSLLSERS